MSDGATFAGAAKVLGYETARSTGATFALGKSSLDPFIRAAALLVVAGCLAAASVGIGGQAPSAVAVPAAIVLVVLGVIRFEHASSKGVMTYVRRSLEVADASGGYRDTQGRALVVDGRAVPAAQIAQVKVFKVGKELQPIHTLFVALKPGSAERAIRVGGSVDARAVYEVGGAFAEALGVPLEPAQPPVPREPVAFGALGLAFLQVAVQLVSVLAVGFSLSMSANAVDAGGAPLTPGQRAPFVALVIIMDLFLPHLFGAIARSLQRARAVEMFGA